MKVGIDIKANREIYGKSVSKKNYIFDTISQLMSDSMPYGVVKTGGLLDPSYIDRYAYVLTNMLTMDTIRMGGIEVPNAAPVNQLEMYTEMLVPMQKIAMVAATANFIDEYLAIFKTDLRDQFIILMGDNILFLTEFISAVANKISELAGFDMKYDSLGFVDFPSIDKKLDTNLPSMKEKVEKEYSKGVASFGFVKAMVDAKTNAKDLILQPGMGNTGSIYPRLFKDLSSEMRVITNEVLGKT
jgi:hypothetical protein